MPMNTDIGGLPFVFRREIENSNSLIKQQCIKKKKPKLVFFYFQSLTCSAFFVRPFLWNLSTPLCHVQHIVVLCRASIPMLVGHIEGTKHGHNGVSLFSIIN